MDNCWRLILVLLLTGMLGCSTTHYRKSADREAYKAIARKTPSVPGAPPSFTIDRQPPAPLDTFRSNTSVEEFLGEAGESERDARIVTLEDALGMAVKGNRTYQSQKETLYLQALSLTLARHQYAPLFSASGRTDYVRSTSDILEVDDAAQMARAVPQVLRSAAQVTSGWAGLLQTLNGNLGQLAGTEGDLIRSYADVAEAAFTATGLNQAKSKIVDERSLEGQTNLGVRMLLKGGALIELGLRSTFLRYLTGDPRVSTSSALAGSITQPLLRGAGSRVAAEQLTQAERNLLYALRDFTRYRQEFAVLIASSYYRVLENRDAARNTWLGYQAFLKSFERQKAWAAEGRLTQADLGRSESAKLDSEASWVGAVRSYKQSLDQFKIDLGLSTDERVVLDDGELKLLVERGIIHPDIKTQDAEEVALGARLDLYTVRDQVDDAARQLRVAANSLKPNLDLVVSGNVDSKPGNDRFDTLDFERATWQAGFDVDLGLDRKAERNAYRSALIDQERAARQRELAEDVVKLAVREAWRALDQAKREYEIRKVGVDLNQRRVEEQNLRAELGRATVLDQVDAQNALTNARLGLTAALIGHTVSRLEFWRDMGILLIKENGQWEEVAKAEEGPWIPSAEPSGPSADRRRPAGEEANAEAPTHDKQP